MKPIARHLLVISTFFAFVAIGHAICLTPQQVTDGVNAVATTPPAKFTSADFVLKVLVKLTADPAAPTDSTQMGTWIANPDAFQVLDPKKPTNSISPDQFPAVCFKRANLWANDGELVIVTGKEANLFAVLVPNTTSDQPAATAAGQSWNGFTIPRAASAKDNTTAPNTYMWLNAAFPTSDPKEIKFYRYKR